MNKKHKLLVVEDDWLNQLAYEKILSVDYDVKICGNDEEFYSALDEGTYDLFLIDLALNSEKNGIDLIIDLRKMDRYKDTPIFVVSAFAFNKDRDLSMTAGANKFIAKPFVNKYLLDELKKYFHSEN